MTFDNKIALVTGASRGIGKAIATTLGRQGVTVIGTATTQHGAEAITTYLADEGSQGAGVALDVTDIKAIDEVIASVTKTWGMVNILVNNAGITRDNLFLRMKEDEWNGVINTNLSAIFHVTKAVIRNMIKAKWGRVISIGSVVGTSGNPGQANYCAAKAGLIGFSKSLAQELASRNITVNTVAPGMIETDMTDKLTADQKEAIYAQIPMAKMGQPQDIANAVLFLASDHAAYITGQTLHVNGGMYMA